MTPQQIFVVSSAVVLVALILSLVFWSLTVGRVKHDARTSARYFVICFGLYVVGQGLALLQGMGLVKSFWNAPSLMYAVAAILFAIGSWYQYRSVR